jgi:hypothetical protein
VNHHRDLERRRQIRPEVKNHESEVKKDWNRRPYFLPNPAFFPSGIFEKSGDVKQVGDEKTPQSEQKEIWVCWHKKQETIPRPRKQKPEKYQSMKWTRKPLRGKIKPRRQGGQQQWFGDENEGLPYGKTGNYIEKGEEEKSGKNNSLYFHDNVGFECP